MNRITSYVTSLAVTLSLALATIGCQDNKEPQKPAPSAKKTTPTVTVPTTKPVKPAPPVVVRPKTLFERLGGTAAISKVVDDFVAIAAPDPNVNFTRKGHPNEWDATPENVAKLKKGLVDFIGSATGGTVAYSGRDMVTAHKGMEITDAEFDALAADLKAALDKNKIPAAEQTELLTIVGTTRKAIVQPAAVKPAVDKPKPDGAKPDVKPEDSKPDAKPDEAKPGTEPKPDDTKAPDEKPATPDAPKKPTPDDAAGKEAPDKDAGVKDPAPAEPASK